MCCDYDGMFTINQCDGVRQPFFDAAHDGVLLGRKLASNVTLPIWSLEDVKLIEFLHISPYQGCLETAWKLRNGHWDRLGEFR